MTDLWCAVRIGFTLYYKSVCVLQRLNALTPVHEQMTYNCTHVASQAAGATGPSGHVSKTCYTPIGACPGSGGGVSPPRGDTLLTLFRVRLCFASILITTQTRSQSQCNTPMDQAYNTPKTPGFLRMIT
eukprot:jgi/Botrbrau1/7057/Bobra.0165s0080.1